MANRWSANGEIPKDWVEAAEPQPVSLGERGFRDVVIWQKILAVLAWFFAALFVISIGLELTGFLD
ncbi:hypothetical protein [Citromicrobium bathyomarinum]|uniref:hypothetical protein n=1 Tax=Citromicrobium bathyomarinum TaxID=72174 RepID=UPI001E4B821D|nr:hypothetical protein [Citromicrobium bathyomarinum]MCD1621437.1 hypothetical protein [Citromicrobium bathyomarinum]